MEGKKGNQLSLKEGLQALVPGYGPRGTAMGQVGPEAASHVSYAPGALKQQQFPTLGSADSAILTRGSPHFLCSLRGAVPKSFSGQITLSAFSMPGQRR